MKSSQANWGGHDGQPSLCMLFAPLKGLCVGMLQLMALADQLEI